MHIWPNSLVWPKGTRTQNNEVEIQFFLVQPKGRFQKRFSGIRPLRGYPPPALTENQSEKKKVFFLSGKGGYPPPP